MYNLELHRKVNGKYRHIKNLLWNKPYPLCKGKKTQYEANEKQHFEFLKITPSV